MQGESADSRKKIIRDVKKIVNGLWDERRFRGSRVVGGGRADFYRAAVKFVEWQYVFYRGTSYNTAGARHSRGWCSYCSDFLSRKRAAGRGASPFYAALDRVHWRKAERDKLISRTVSFSTANDRVERERTTFPTSDLYASVARIYARDASIAPAGRRRQCKPYLRETGKTPFAAMQVPWDYRGSVKNSVFLLRVKSIETSTFSSITGDQIDHSEIIWRLIWWWYLRLDFVPNHAFL